MRTSKEDLGFTKSSTFYFTISALARSRIKSGAAVGQFDVTITCRAEIRVLFIFIYIYI